MKRSICVVSVILSAMFSSAAVYSTAMYRPPWTYEYVVEPVYEPVRKSGYVIKKYIGKATEVVIPGYFEDGFSGYFDIALIIGKGAFQGNADITSVAIPEGVVSIGASAFEGCAKLATVILPASLRTIDRRCFADCSSLTNIVIPDSAQKIQFTGDSAFVNTKLSPAVKAKLHALSTIRYPLKEFECSLF